LCHSCYETYRLRQKAYGRWQTIFVDAEPVRQHVETLRSSGVGSRRIAELSGVSRSVIQALINGRKKYGNQPSKLISAANANALLAVAPAPANGAYIDITGTTRRLQALVAIGYTQSELAARLGITPGNATDLFHGRGKALVATAKRVADLFAELAMTPGPSPRARTYAAKRGWAAPLAWDDNIDDPDAKPDLGQRRAIRWDERYLELRELGFKDVEIAAKLGIQLHSLMRQLDRYSIPQSAELKLLMHERMCVR
jgi:transcriptional regulator with XRE-family HTH domain